MSQENADLICRMWKEQMERDPTTLDLSLVDPDIVYEDEVLPDHGGETYHGHEGLLRAWARAIEPWANFTNEIEWAREAGDEVVSCHVMRGHGKGSGVPVEGRYAYIWRLRDGVVVYCKSFTDPARALRASGLSE